MEIWVITRPSVHASAIQDGFIGAPLSLNTGATMHAAPVPHRVVDLFSAMLRRPFSDMCCALLRCSGVMCAVCGCKSIIHRHMRSSLWNLSIIDSASPTVGMVRGPSISVTHYWAWVCVCVCVCACEHLGVYAHVKKRLERGWRKTHNVREGAWRSAV